LFHFHTWVHNISVMFTCLCPLLPPFPNHWSQSSDRTCFTFLPSVFLKKDFCLFMMIIQGVSLWHFHICVFCECALYPSFVHPLHYSPFYHSPLPIVVSTGWNFLYSYLYRKYINHIHLLFFLHLPSLSQ
jgi:hypothetical protein